MDTLLRPNFTKQLAARLLQGESINLIAAHGLGRRRTLTDLRSLLPKDMRLLYADLKFCLNDFPATLAELCAQAGLDSARVSNLGDLIGLLSQIPVPALLILHNIDLLRCSAHDPLFDSAMLPHLARIAEHRHLALLTVSEDIHPDWHLPCEPLAIPASD